MATIKGNILTVNGKEFKIRYTTETRVVIMGDELEGMFGDEFPISKVTKVEK